MTNKNPTEARIGLTELPPKLKAVLKHVAQGLSNTEIAEAQRVSPYTVKNQIADLCERLGVKGRRGLMSIAMEHGDMVAIPEHPEQKITHFRERCNGLSTAETKVLALVVQGRSNKEIAPTLFRSPRTIKNHVASILRQTGIDERRELMVMWHVTYGVEGHPECPSATEEPVAPPTREGGNRFTGWSARVSKPNDLSRLARG